MIELGSKLQLYDIFGIFRMQNLIPVLRIDGSKILQVYFLFTKDFRLSHMMLENYICSLFSYAVISIIIIMPNVGSVLFLEYGYYSLFLVFALVEMGTKVGSRGKCRGFRNSKYKIIRILTNIYVHSSDCLSMTVFCFSISFTNCMLFCCPYSLEYFFHLGNLIISFLLSTSLHLRLHPPSLVPLCSLLERLQDHTLNV